MSSEPNWPGMPTSVTIWGRRAGPESSVGWKIDNLPVPPNTTFFLSFRDVTCLEANRVEGAAPHVRRVGRAIVDIWEMDTMDGAPPDAV